MRKFLKWLRRTNDLQIGVETLRIKVEAQQKQIKELLDFKDYIMTATEAKKKAEPSITEVDRRKRWLNGNPDETLTSGKKA